MIKEIREAKEHARQAAVHRAACDATLNQMVKFMRDNNLPIEEVERIMRQALQDKDPHSVEDLIKEFRRMAA